MYEQTHPWSVLHSSLRNSSRAERRIVSKQYLTGVLQLGQNCKWLSYLHFKMFWGILVDKFNCLIHIRGQNNTAGTLWRFEYCAHKILPPFWKCCNFLWNQAHHCFG